MAAAVGLELGVLNHALVVHLDLKAHHVAAGGGADHAGADIVILDVERADVARMLVVVHEFFAVCHVLYLRRRALARLSGQCCVLCGFRGISVRTTEPD